jgi:hypothetical protein
VSSWSEARITEMNVVKIVMRMAPRTAAPNDWISRPGTSGAAIVSMIALMTSDTRPIVSTDRGRVSSTRMGRTRALRRPTTTAPSNAARGSVTMNPGTIWPTR